MIYRTATINDLEQLATLFDNYRVFYKKPSDTIQSRLFLKERIQKNESEIYVAENEKQALVGFVQLYPIFSSTRLKRLWLLNDLYVLPNFRSQGISIELINKAKELCVTTNACGLQLETAKTNLIGNQLYPKTGFVLEEDTHFYAWNME